MTTRFPTSYVFFFWRMNQWIWSTLLLELYYFPRWSLTQIIFRSGKSVHVFPWEGSRVPQRQVENRKSGPQRNALNNQDHDIQHARCPYKLDSEKSIVAGTALTHEGFTREHHQTKWWIFQLAIFRLPECSSFTVVSCLYLQLCPEDSIPASDLI